MQGRAGGRAGRSEAGAAEVGMAARQVGSVRRSCDRGPRRDKGRIGAHGAHGTSDAWIQQRRGMQDP